MHSLDVSALKKRKSMVCILIQMLSCVNFPLVRMVLLLLHKVAQHAANNLMNADNLGTIFTPHMFYPKDISELSAKMTSVVSFMITHAPEIILPPRLLAIDALTYLRKKRAELGTSEDSLTSLGSISSGSNLAATKRKHCNDETDEAEAPINTVVTFGSRCPGKVEHDTTAIELAKLHAHVQNMEDSNTKRMFLKRVNENSHKKDSTCKSIGDSIKRTFSKRYRSKSRSKTPEKVLESPATLPASKSKCTQTATTPKVKLPLLNTSVELLQESPYPLHRAAVRNLCKAEGGLSRGKNTPEFSPIHNSRAGTESQQPAASTPLSHKSPLKPTNQNSSDGCWQPSLKKTKPSKVLMVYHKKLDDMKDHPATPPRVSGKMTLNDSGFNC
ncbi:hypothetical protein EB796_010542 [Bugula neritina]|uniref:Rho-GAP domain-containing protein n=1 Tax=Bugula neritina TaxID=10212 RepID=A0A7J7JZQ8_BUGNE|nr:hypothetical protein EB796_010542 [Bugula neritina]